jgi:hypothetical protein
VSGKEMRRDIHTMNGSRQAVFLALFSKYRDYF